MTPAPDLEEEITDAAIREWEADKARNEEGVRDIVEGWDKGPIPDSIPDELPPLVVPPSKGGRTPVRPPPVLAGVPGIHAPEGRPWRPPNRVPVVPAPWRESVPVYGGLYQGLVKATFPDREPVGPGYGQALIDKLIRREFDWQEAMWAAGNALLIGGVVSLMGKGIYNPRVLAMAETFGLRRNVNPRGGGFRGFFNSADMVLNWFSQRIQREEIERIPIQ
jgi:hypothetical protein